ncbi:Gfo/Idh/MocA family protein [Saliphagus infecundisoli]|uniref:Gfo/Idh/MocA family protein n=1 Tax=Saliphagus infecundisoli TaxID=1849069 RepID=A0ABD5QAW8_9EURY|nr:Gfo/Idh/MocA family oxidoreductase [Saliphagus infecundisoli]
MTWRFVGANFDQMHMNTNLQWVDNHPNAKIVGVCDETPETSTGSLSDAVDDLGLSDDIVFEDLDKCLETVDTDIVIGCPRNSLHADFVEQVAPYGFHIVIEKPLSVSLSDADRMLEAMAGTDGTLFINWPAAWDAERHTIRRLVSESVIGDIVELQYYGGNAGAPPNDSWFYEPADGGGSMLDYLGYGSTFSTWFRGGELPETVTAESYTPDNGPVDVQSATICRYEDGLSTLQTTWRMLTNPWEIQPTNKKGYEIIGTEGAITNRTEGDVIRVSTAEEPEGYTVAADPLEPQYQDLAHYVIYCLENDVEPEGPLDPQFCREAHRIVETARRSADAGKRLDLVD